MSKEKIKEFPDLTEKLAAPTKKSVFERQRAEAEAKRKREEAETAAVYEDFVKSFEDDQPHANLGFGARQGGFGGGMPGGRGGFGGGPPKRHFVPTGPRGLNSGPGSLGPTPASVGFKKRALDGSVGAGVGKKEVSKGSLFSYDDEPVEEKKAAKAFQHSDDEDEAVGDSKAAERAAPKPTLHLSSLPPGTSPAVIKSLIPGTVTVDGVKILPPSQPGSTERKSMSAIVTLAKDTPATDIETVVNGLQRRYLGWGFYLSIARHLSSAALSGTGLGVGINPIVSGSSSLPFGAKPVVPQGPGPAAPLNRAPPPGSYRGFAPPSSYGPQAGRFGPVPTVQVAVQPPSDVKELKLIHKTLEALITHGPEFEALLMSRQEVQRDEKWAWIWDARSPGGLWYRWRLWELLTGDKVKKARFGDTGHRLFDSAAPWIPPEQNLRFEYTTQFDQLVSSSDYDTSEDEAEDDEEVQKRKQELAEASSSGERLYLDPYGRAKLTHLLARLPQTTAKLRKGDVARVTAFAISHAGRGAEEVVDMIVSNVETPFSWSRANPSHKPSPQQENPDDTPAAEDATSRLPLQGESDPSSSKLIALYLISDILSSSATGGVRHAWKFRQLFETAFRQRRVFEKLGRLEKEYSWGRLRAEKWKRSVQSVLSLWEAWCVFSAERQEGFVRGFLSPPETVEEAREREKREKEREARERERVKGEGRGASKWKSVGGEGSGTPVGQGGDGDADVDGAPIEEDVDGMPMEDVDGEPIEEDVDGEPMEDDFDGEPMVEDTEPPSAGQPPSVGRDVVPTPESSYVPPGASSDAAGPKETEAAKARRRRPKAEDMFADSD